MRTQAAADSPVRSAELRQRCAPYRRLLALTVAVVVCPIATADEDRTQPKRDFFYAVPVGELDITEGSLRSNQRRAGWRRRQLRNYMQPYVAMDRGEEAYVGNHSWTAPVSGMLNQARLVVRADHAGELTGTIYFPLADFSGMTRARFRIANDVARADNAEEFQRLKSRHYQNLNRWGSAGAAWFRHQADAASAVRQRDRNRRANESMMQRTFALFSGGRAVSENLQLDRQLMGELAETGQQHPVDSIEGITIQEIDWAPLIGDAQPKLDALASSVPADQHAIFFPSFDAAVQLADEFAANGRWILSLAEPASQSADVVGFYQRQMCLSLDAVSRALGPQLASSVALTGSDPYFRTGTDVAVLFESSNPELLEQFLLSKVRAVVLVGGLELEVGTVGQLQYYGAQSKNRTVSVYIAKSDGLLIVSNSRVQLERLSAVLEGQSPSLASAPEYTFFRHRYTVGAADEAAFVFLSDATIRRWCGPRWRVGTSRRTRDAAVLAELQAQHVDAIVARDVARRVLPTEFVLSSAGTFELQDVGVHHSQHGNLRFMTPLAEMQLDTVSELEKNAYERWRDRYQRNWRWAFDPIGIRLTMNKRQIKADMTIMPLIGQSEYQQLVNLSGGASLTTHSGDPHDALLHYVLAINKDSEFFRRWGGVLGSVTGLRNENPLSWLGASVAVYLDDSPIWEEIARLTPDEDQLDERLREMLDRFPLGVYAEVSSGFRLTAFLAAMRTFIEQSSPGMTVWETREHAGQPYVRVSLTERARRGNDELEDVALYYAPAGDSLTVTLDESLMQRALDRAKLRLEQPQPNDGGATGDKPMELPTANWSGQNMALRVRRKAIDAVTSIGAEQYQLAMQARCWSNLPILNEWKRLFPEHDPVSLHQTLWHVQLVCPGGGNYVWNDQWKTIESTVYGHPGQPKRGPAMPPLVEQLSAAEFGVTFENQGLRAKMQLDMATPAGD